jgi:peptidoglycan/xylan/chitin deacetylase (PgdA/CDA1 family)
MARGPVALAAVLSLLLAACGGGSDDGGAAGSSTTTGAQTTSPPGAPPPTTTASPAPSVPAVPAALRGQDVEVMPTSRPVVALTFDAGANSDARTIAAVNDPRLRRRAVDRRHPRLAGHERGHDRAAGDRPGHGALRPGAIVLMHIGSNPDDGTTLDADALPGMIGLMRAAGYGFVTLDELLAH